ncbi:MAG: GDSL-type esterase/lipase family protein [Planctomycetota bacterium]
MKPRTLARCSLVLSPALLLGGLELLFRALDLFPPPHFFKAVRGAAGESLRTTGHPIPVAYGRDPCLFAPRKAPGTKRVFMIGESSVHGFPYFPWSTIPAYLQARLRRILPDQRIEVINAGVPGFTSANIAQGFDEALDYEPDLIIVYCGHNELMLSHHEEIADDATVTRRALSWLRDRRVMRALRALLHIVPKESFGLPFPADDLLAIHDQPRVPRPLLAAGYERYERYLRGMLGHAADRHVPVLCCKLVSNLLQQPPHWAYFERVQGDAARAQFRADLEHALELFEAHRASEAEPLLADLEQRDPAVASVAFAHGRVLLALGRSDEALAAFVRAKDEDGMPMRATTRLLDIIARVAADAHVPLLDPWPSFIAASKQGVPGFDLLSDYCHPNIDGQYLLATLILRELQQAQLLARADEFQFAREAPRENTSKSSA